MVFSKLIKKLQLPSVYSEAALESIGAEKLELVAQTPDSLKPGDMVTFSYGRSLFGSRKFLVVSTKAAPDGKFLSGRGNYLICGYDLTNKETLPGLVMIFNSFYKKRRSTYTRLKNTMNSIFGKNNYKTFNTRKMSSVFNLNTRKPDTPKVSKGTIK
jgi:hypothetical protein